MTEQLEERLGAALAARAGEEADVTGLAAGARSRLRSRRRTTVAVAAVAVAVAAVAAVPTALALTGPGARPAPGPGPATSAPDPTATVDPAPAGLRVESWRDLTTLVPDAWGYGGGSDWCADDGEPRPEVVRTGGDVLSIDCTPQQGYGLYFGDGSAISWARDSGDVWRYGWNSPDQVKVYPENAWLGLYLGAGDRYVMVVTPDESTTRTVLATVRTVDGRDPNGCAVRDGQDAAAGEGERLSLCRYGGDGWLAESELLSDDVPPSEP